MVNSILYIYLSSFLQLLLKETIVSDILNRLLRKEENETNYSLLSNEPYINYDSLTSNLKRKNDIYQYLIKSS